MLPALPFFDVNWSLKPLAQPVDLFNLLFLGLLASALCFVTWSPGGQTAGGHQNHGLYLPGTSHHGGNISAGSAGKTNRAGGSGVYLTLLGLVISERQVAPGGNTIAEQTEKIS